ncbi:hypothetical protein Lal_00023782 [Lupinus albus]|nr:hypothetical protein Lal_00023782 [Lupinus albus]
MTLPSILMRAIMLLGISQTATNPLEFDLEIQDKSVKENVIVDHLLRLVNSNVTAKERDITDAFPYEKLFHIRERLWFSDITNYKATRILPKLGYQQKKKFFWDATHYLWDDPHLLKVLYVMSTLLYLMTLKL